MMICFMIDSIVERQPGETSSGSFVFRHGRAEKIARAKSKKSSRVSRSFTSSQVENK